MSNHGLIGGCWYDDASTSVLVVTNKSMTETSIPLKEVYQQSKMNNIIQNEVIMCKLELKQPVFKSTIQG